MEDPHIVYDREGTGSPLVLLHGLGHRRQTWRPVMAHLCRHHEVLALDLPGFGQSPPPADSAPYDMDALVGAVRRLCHRLGWTRPHVAGNSLGGAIALELGARGAAESVTVFSPIGFASSVGSVGARLLTGAARTAAFVPEPLRMAVAGSPPGRAVARRVLRGDPSSPSARRLTFDASVLSAGSPFLRLAGHVAGYSFRAGSVSCPVTIAWGDRDRVLSPAGARRALRRIGHARQVTMLGCGHIPMADNPRAVATEILRTCRAGEEGDDAEETAACSRADGCGCDTGP